MTRLTVFLLLVQFSSFGQSPEKNTNPSILEISNEDGMFGLVTNSGEVVVHAQYAEIQQKCDFLVCKTPDNQIELRNAEGVSLFEEEFVDVRIMCLTNPIIVAKDKHGKIGLYNELGESICPTEFSAIPTVNNYPEGSAKLVLSKTGGGNCLLSTSVDSSGQTIRLNYYRLKTDRFDFA